MQSALIHAICSDPCNLLPLVCFVTPSNLVIGSKMLCMLARQLRTPISGLHELRMLAAPRTDTWVTYGYLDFACSPTAATGAPPSAAEGMSSTTTSQRPKGASVSMDTAPAGPVVMPCSCALGI